MTSSVKVFFFYFLAEWKEDKKLRIFCIRSIGINDSKVFFIILYIRVLYKCVLYGVIT